MLESVCRERYERLTGELKEVNYELDNFKKYVAKRDGLEKVIFKLKTQNDGVED